MPSFFTKRRHLPAFKRLRSGILKSHENLKLDPSRELPTINLTKKNRSFGIHVRKRSLGISIITAPYYYLLFLTDLHEHKIGIRNKMFQ